MPLGISALLTGKTKMKDEKERIPDDDDLPLLRVASQTGRPVFLWPCNSVVQSMFTQGFERDLPLLWGQSVRNDPGEG